MAHLHGVFLDWQSLPTAERWTLGEQETSARAHLKALRIKNQDHVIFLDGKGHHLIAEVQDSRQLSFQTIRRESFRQRRPEVTVYLSAPRGDDLDRCIQASCELGVQKLVLFRSDHSAHTTTPNSGRLVRIAQASCEQSLNPWLPAIDIEFDKNLKALMNEATAKKLTTLVCDEVLADGIGTWHAPPKADQALAIFIGPEGGWSDNERTHFDTIASAQRIGLGPTVLKVPTALTAILSILRQHHES